MACPLAAERIWLEKSRYHDAEKDYFEFLSKLMKDSLNTNKSGIHEQITSANDALDDITAATTMVAAEKINVIPNNKASKKSKKAKQQQQQQQNISSTSAPIDSSSPVVMMTLPTKQQDNIKVKQVKLTEEVSSNSKLIAKNTNVEQNDPSVPAERKKKKKKNKNTSSNENQGPLTVSNQSTLVSEIAKARQHIKNSLEKMDGIAGGENVFEKFALLEKENSNLKQIVENLKKSQLESEKRIKALEVKLESLSLASSAKQEQNVVKKDDKCDEDDDVDLFGSESEEEDDEAAKVREQRLAEYAAKKSKKPTLIAKSNVILDVKPWDDETDLKQMEQEIRKISTDGLLWGASKFVPVAYGIKKLSISCVVEDEKVSIDWLTEEIEKLEDYVQSVDVAAFNKI